MRLYLASLAAGVLVGAIYSLLNVRSPAPPIIALIGLLGILIGEQAVPLLRQCWRNGTVDAVWYRTTCHPHIFGHLPGGPQRPLDTARNGDQAAPSHPPQPEGQRDDKT
ncbi:DUF1427 family protein [Labrenzia sp. 011]|uniref:DUF1427 family protein n=1 Tax=Labrenzia sp. 011 TaxID=2171494 RepID=UPI000D518B97|nr:DUF1427 family protein [Labrenzia sp. 011]PVB62486.1 XapX domain-containing protein [Labrenzia sp. 011]